VFAVNGLRPPTTRFQQFNEWMGQEVVTFDDYKVAGLTANGITAVA
jgi:hypothetical protein